MCVLDEVYGFENNIKHGYFSGEDTFRSHYDEKRNKSSLQTQKSDQGETNSQI